LPFSVQRRPKVALLTIRMTYNRVRFAHLHVQVSERGLNLLPAER
jgi:hypothetical protein